MTFPPPAKRLWVCPACHGVVVGTYNVDPMRKECSKLWHRAIAEECEYVSVSVGESALRDSLTEALCWLYGHSSMPEAERLAEALIERHGVTLDELDAADKRLPSLHSG